MPVETLKNMNHSTAKHASWNVRVLSARPTAYELQARGETVKPKNLPCIPVSQAPKQFRM